MRGGFSDLVEDRVDPTDSPLQSCRHEPDNCQQGFESPLQSSYVRLTCLSMYYMLVQDIVHVAVLSTILPS